MPIAWQGPHLPTKAWSPAEHKFPANAHPDILHLLTGSDSRSGAGVRWPLVCAWSLTPSRDHESGDRAGGSVQGRHQEAARF